MLNELLEIEKILLEHQKVLGTHKTKYQNHVNRVFEICKILDPEPTHHSKYAIAATYHDIGIWTANTFDYLKPSVELAKDYLQKNGKSAWIEEVGLMINQHHKLAKYKGDFQTTIETFRKADAIDLSFGLIRFSIQSRVIRKIQATYPTAGFHRFLIKMFFKNLLKKPWRPLPMFKW